ncbi:rod shape-determining protein MreD [bacterium]|nr:rod shape-determining protein MreD [bacterium]
MRLLALFSLATVIALALETIIPRWLPLGPLMPDLVLVLAVDLGLRHQQATAALMAFGMGYAADSFSGAHLGLEAFVLTLAFLIAYALSRYLISSSAAIGVFVVVIGEFMIGAGQYAASAGWNSAGGFAAILPAIAWRALASALVAPSIFALMEAAARMVGLRQHAVRE